MSETPSEKVAAACQYMTTGQTASEYNNCIARNMATLGSAEKFNITKNEWLAPPDVVNALGKFGLHWNNKGFDIPGTTFAYAFDNQTKNIRFEKGAFNGQEGLKMTIENTSGPDNIVIITSDILIQDGDVIAHFADFMPARIDRTPEKPIPQVQALYDKYRDSECVQITGSEDHFMSANRGTLKTDEIAVYTGMRSGNPFFFYENGNFIQGYNHDIKMTPQQLDEYIQKMVERNTKSKARSKELGY